MLNPDSRFSSAARVIESAVRERAFPAAVIEVGTATQPLWRQSFGRLRFDERAPATADDIIFDLASLTKVVSTASIVMQAVERGELGLDDPVADHVSAWRGGDRADVTLRDLLSHCSGLPWHVPFFRTLEGRADVERAICETPLDYPPRSKSIYSDLDFMLLGFILEQVSPLPARFDAVKTQAGVIDEVQFLPPDVWKPRIAPTEIDPWRGRLLVGEVDDENAFALGGVAGHAGLFGTAGAVGQFARHLLQILDGRQGAFQRATVVTFTTRRESIPGSSRALGWDTMLPSSSCGARMSARSFGHTGFTGTSLWIDPERSAYVVLLTNRIHPDRSNDAIKTVRPAVHDAVMQELDQNRPG
jgi:CubicO group peptidase (beta-lactamase class C family)